VLVFHDVSEQRRLHREMRHRATHDPLTGLVNRGEFEARLTRLLAHVDPGADANHALLYIDLDQFKIVNDACGHGAGDALLKQVSAMLGHCIRAGDSLARLGGDEFGVILETCDVESAKHVAQNICTQMDAFRFVHDDRRFRVGTSIGLVPVDHRWPSIKALLQAADASCCAAKQGGRNRVHTWRDSDSTLGARRGDMRWVSRLETALDDDRFELFGQRIEPVAGPAGGLHVEVLLRLREADGDLVLPVAFLAAAERFHLATRIDRWVLHNVFERLERARHAGLDVERMSINLSDQSLGDGEFRRDLKQMLCDARFDVHRLCFEIAESAAITHLADARGFIDELRAVGVRVALDDFGAGASSFGYLKQLPVDFIKIDGHFVRHLLDDELNDVAVRCFCDVARIVGAQTIAKFVERAEIRDALCDIGVDLVQGSVIHRPEPLADLLTRATTVRVAAAT
jgi:diguanylate cyclase (GGDEF)-like protein